MEILNTFRERRLALSTPSSASHPDLKGYRFLVVDDDPEILRDLCAQIQSLGAEAVGIQDSLQVLTTLQTQIPFDGMLLDWQIPGLSGLEIIQAARQAQLLPPIVLMATGHDSWDLEAESQGLPIDHILTKPVGVQQLRTCLEQLGLYQLQPLNPPKASVNAHKILVVEDNEINLLILREILQEEGHQVTEARHGLEALDLWIQHQGNFDLVFLDWQMPIMNGEETLQAFRTAKASQNQTPIVVLTADIRPEIIEYLKKQGIQDVLSKPLDPALIEETVQRWCAD